MGADTYQSYSSERNPSEDITLILKTFRKILKNPLQLFTLSSEDRGRLIKKIRKLLKDADPK